MNYCPHCDMVKRSQAFYRNASRANGLSILCKPCYRKYESAPDRRAKRTWNTLKTRIRTQPAYSGVEIRMERDEFLEWAIPEYEGWMADNPNQTPSLDRIDPSQHYSLGNLRILSRGENTRLARNHKNVHAPSGKAWCGVCRRYLPTNSFWKNSVAFNGKQSRCKTCQATAVSNSRVRVRQDRKAILRKRASRPKT